MQRARVVMTAPASGVFIAFTTVNQAAAQSTIVERSPDIGIEQITVSGGVIVQDLTRCAPDGEVSVIPVAEGTSGIVNVLVRAHARDVDVFASLLLHPGGQTTMTRSGPDGQVGLYGASFFTGLDRETAFTIVPAYRPIVEALLGDPFVDDDGRIGADLSFAIGSEMGTDDA